MVEKDQCFSSLITLLLKVEIGPVTFFSRRREKGDYSCLLVYKVTYVLLLIQEYYIRILGIQGILYPIQ